MGKYWTDKTDNVDFISADDFNSAFSGIETDVNSLDTSKANKSETESALALKTNNEDFTSHVADFAAHKTDAAAHEEAFSAERKRFNPLYCNALFGSAEGESITVSDAVEGTPLALTLYGKCTETLTDSSAEKSHDNPAVITGIGESGSVTVTVTDADGTAQEIAIPLSAPLYKLDARPGLETDPNWSIKTDDIVGTKLVRRTVRDEFDGTEDWYVNGDIKNGLIRYFVSGIYGLSIAGTKPILCTHFNFSPINAANFYVENYCVHYVFDAITGIGWFGICVSAERFPTVDDFKTWLAEQKAAGTPVSVIRPINPVETDITDTEAGQALLALVSQNGATFTNSEGADMSLTYNRDINKALAEINNAIIALGGTI